MKIESHYFFYNMAEQITKGTVGVHVDRREKGKLGIEASIRAAIQELPGSRCAQIFTHGPKGKAMNRFNTEELRELCHEHRIYVHSTYFTTWKDLAHMQEQFSLAASLGAQGVVLHLGKISPEAHIEVLAKLRIAPVRLDNAKCAHLAKQRTCRIILEMRALKPDRWTYQTPAEINELCEALQLAGFTSDRVIICLDTAHIAAARIALRTRKDADLYMAALKYPEYIGLLHLNGNTYNPAERAGDHHCVPMSAEDWVWSLGGAPIAVADSGAAALTEWFTSRGRDVILEQDFSKELVKFHSELTK